MEDNIRGRPGISKLKLEELYVVNTWWCLRPRLALASRDGEDVNDRTKTCSKISGARRAPSPVFFFCFRSAKNVLVVRVSLHSHT